MNKIIKTLSLSILGVALGAGFMLALVAELDRQAQADFDACIERMIASNMTIECKLDK